MVNHSQARRAEVHLDWKQPGSTVSVTDDGIGKPAATQGGHGLNGIRERVAAAGGSVEFANGAKGFHVTAAFR